MSVSVSVSVAVCLCVCACRCVAVSVWGGGGGGGQYMKRFKIKFASPTENRAKTHTSSNYSLSVQIITFHRLGNFSILVLLRKYSLESRNISKFIWIFTGKIAKKS